MSKIVKSRRRGGAPRASAAGEAHVPSPSASAGDKKLLALLAQWPAVRKRGDSADDEYDAASERYFSARPQVPVATVDDKRLFMGGPRAGERYDDQAIANLRTMIETAGAPRDDDFPFAKEFKARARQIVADWEAYRVGDEAAREASGLNAARRDMDAAHVVMRRLFIASPPRRRQVKPVRWPRSRPSPTFSRMRWGAPTRTRRMTSFSRPCATCAGSARKTSTARDGVEARSQNETRLISTGAAARVARPRPKRAIGTLCGPAAGATRRPFRFGALASHSVHRNTGSNIGHLLDSPPTKPCKCLISLARPRGIEPLFSP